MKNTEHVQVVRRILCVAMLWSCPGLTSADTLIFDTSDSPFTTGVKNQGWWSDTDYNVDTKHNYFTGFNQLNSDHRSFFTFDLSSLTGPVDSATLELTRFIYIPGQASETLGLFDVSTGAATLNNNHGTSADIYLDLGSGKNYGSFVITDGPQNDVLSFPLTSDAIDDINAAAGGFLSIGGALTSVNGSGSEGFFGFSGTGGVQRLVLETLDSLLLGDANNDLRVSGSDIIVILENFGMIEPGVPPAAPSGLFIGDANDDGRVTGQDIIVVQENFGTIAGSVPASPIPEPGSLVLFAIAGLGIGLRAAWRT